MRLWRADRVLSIDLRPRRGYQQVAFDVNQLLGRTWLRDAMAEWIGDAPVKLRITAQQAARLKLDWYYRYARYEELPNGQVLMTFGEDKPEFVLDLVRWLGPGAELLEPQVWRAQLRDELAAMLALYTD
jgi:predicted DNA-binding transcriptional regulator YafY